jgi:hypothetical protein
MSLAKKNTGKRPTSKRAGNAPVIVTKTTDAKVSPFSKKVKAMNKLLSKATLLSPVGNQAV